MGVAKTVRGGAMRSRSQRISSLDSSSSGNKGDARVNALACRAKFLAEKFLGVVQVGGHHVFQQDAETGTGCAQGQPAAQRSGSDDGDCSGQEGAYLAFSATATSSALGLAWSRCSATRVRSSALSAGMVASTRRRVTATSSI